MAMLIESLDDKYPQETGDCTMCNTYYVGWDVGAWKCAKTQFANSSQDCITILNAEGQLLFAWMGNIYDYTTTSLVNFLNALIEDTKTSPKKPKGVNICFSREPKITENDIIVIAIDAVLGMPKRASSLFDLNPKCAQADMSDSSETSVPLDSDEIEKSCIFRLVEQRLLQLPKTNPPLSLLKDRLGSQATKALFTLKQWNFKWNEENVVWECEKKNCEKKNCEKNTAFETYPSLVTININFQPKPLTGEIMYNNNQICKEGILPPQGNEDLKKWNLRWSDLRDSLVCAMVALKFRDALLPPNDSEKTFARQEGWIWLPKEAWNNNTQEIN